MKVLRPTFLRLGILAIICTTGCQSKKPKPNSELSNIELQRGDIVLCGGDQFGEVRFSLSCKYSARKAFDLAVSLLHSFEYDEAEKAFAKVIDADPDCAMAYWGVAMSMYHSLWAPPSREYLEKGSKILQIAEQLPKSSKEQEYLDAIGAFYKDWVAIDHKTRALRMEKKMEAIYKNHEEDTEAAIFYSLALNSTADPTDKTYSNQKKAGRILESIFPNQPNHPGIAHYIIHNYDNPKLAHLALSTARRYAEIAPSSAHAQHMPSHIFTRLGLWQESIQSNLNSTAAARCYAENGDMEGHWDEELHGMDYLVYAYLQLAENKKALEQNKYLQSFKKVFPINFKVAYASAAIQARIVLENKQWNKAARLQLPAVEIPWNLFPWQKSLLHFTRALGASHSGDIEAAEKEIIVLQSLHQELENKEEQYKANQVLIQVKASQAWLNFAKGNNEQAIVLMQEAADMEDNTEKNPVTPCEVIPASELLGDLLLAMNEPRQALEAYELDLKGHPNRFNGIYGAAVAAKGAGHTTKAKSYFENLLKQTESSHSGRTEIEVARAFVEQKAS